MPYRITKNIKVAMVLEDGELIFEFRRPTNEEKNQFFHEQIDLKSTGAEQLNDFDRLRIEMYDRFIEGAYVENGNGREALVGEDDQPVTAVDLPEDLKVKAAMKAFELMALHVKNC
jgi:hypothetical protein